MNFYQGGLFALDRNESCFIKYLIDIIKSAQLRFKNDQWDINMDFEECISSIRKYGEPQCINYWYNMIRNQRSGYLRTSSIGLLGRNDSTCEECPWRKNKTWQSDSAILNGIKLVRDAFGRCDSPIGDFIEYNICRFFPHLMKITGNHHPEYSSILRRHYTAPKLFCEDIETEIGMQQMYYFLNCCGSEPLIQFYQALVCCQERLYFPMKKITHDCGLAWKPKNKQQLWSVAFEVVHLLVRSSADTAATGRTVFREKVRYRYQSAGSGSE